MRFRTIPAALMLGLAAVSFAQEKDEDHLAYHPESTASATAAGKAGRATDAAKMGAHMKAMRQMHEKMAAAKTAAEREALMPEHMKVMREGMSMMAGMSPGQAAGSLAARQQMSEQRMDMMQSMMDCMPMAPAAPGK